MMMIKWMMDKAIQWTVVLVLVVLMSVVCVQSWGQVTSRWDRDEVLTLEQKDEMWGLMFPAPTSEELERGYERVKRELRRLQLDDGDAVLVEVEQRLDALKVVER